ncbi:MAG TPA: hypothetical protein PKX27_12040, partial [Bacteroidales bacterium]|nr:hypothetical protein [Bacteroidales bacterium]
MKYIILLLTLFSGVSGIAQGQTKYPSENVIITTRKNPTRVWTNEKEELFINVSPKDFRNFKANGFVSY